MNKRFFALITILIAMVAILVGIYTTGALSPKTDFDTKFMSGTIYGDAVLNKNHNRHCEWWVNYEDTTNKISYSFLILKDGTFLMDVFKFSGFQQMESKTYNNIEWDIYFLKTAKTSNFHNNENSTIFESPIFYYNYVCTTSQNGTDYFIFLYSNKVTGSESLNSDLFSNYVDPLIESINLKNVDYPPTFQELYKSAY